MSPAAEARGGQSTPRVAVVGGGIMGVSVAYFLARRGVACDVFEASPVLGGLAGPMTLPDGTSVDRFYHAILSSDAHLAGICENLGIADQLRFKETRTNFYVGGGLHSMNSLVEFLAFRPLSPIGRIRLGMTVAAAQLYRDWRRLETVDVRDWLRRLGGKEVYERLWEPMLHVKFDGSVQGIPATWMWARLVRMKSTRGGANQRERAGHLVGGYATLLEAMARAVRAAGGRIELRRPVSEIVLDDSGVSAIRIDGQVEPYRHAVVAMQGPLVARLVPRADAAWRAVLEGIPYLGILCPLMVLDRPLTGTWVINIADATIPFTGVIETTSYIDPALVGGHHLVYVPKYTAPESSWFSASDEDVREAWLSAVERIVPSFDRAWVRHFVVHRERFVEPLRLIGAKALIPGTRAPARGLYLATTAQVYPALTNGESVTRVASAAADQVLGDLGAS